MTLIRDDVRQNVSLNAGCSATCQRSRGEERKKEMCSYERETWIERGSDEGGWSLFWQQPVYDTEKRSASECRAWYVCSLHLETLSAHTAHTATLPTAHTHTPMYFWPQWHINTAVAMTQQQVLPNAHIFHSPIYNWIDLESNKLKCETFPCLMG